MPTNKKAERRRPLVAHNLRRALLMSIKHWERILDGKDHSADASACHLCKICERIHVSAFGFYCDFCPLGRAGMRCGKYGSPWHNTRWVRDEINCVVPQDTWSAEGVESVEIMLTCLYLLREAFKDLPIHISEE